MPSVFPRRSRERVMTGFAGFDSAPPLPHGGQAHRCLPDGMGWQFEPKWTAFAAGFRDGDEVVLQSKSGRPLGRYFPEVVALVRALPEPRLVLDGELIVRLDGAPGRARGVPPPRETRASPALARDFGPGACASLARRDRRRARRRRREAVARTLSSGERAMLKVKLMRSADAWSAASATAPGSGWSARCCSACATSGRLDHVGFHLVHPSRGQAGADRAAGEPIAPPGFTARPGRAEPLDGGRSAECSRCAGVVVRGGATIRSPAAGSARHQILRWRPDKGAGAQCTIDQYDPP